MNRLGIKYEFDDIEYDMYGYRKKKTFSCYFWEQLSGYKAIRNFADIFFLYVATKYITNPTNTAMTFIVLGFLYTCFIKSFDSYIVKA